MDTRQESRSSRPRRSDASRRADGSLGTPGPRPRPRRKAPHKRNGSRIVLVAVLAVALIALVVAVPVGISWALGRRAPQAPAAAPTASVAATSTPEPTAVADSKPQSDSGSAAVSAESSATEDTSWQERYRGKLVLGFKPEPGYKAVALTFDDGPNRQTPYVVKTVQKYGGTGTFFFSGTLLKRKGGTKHALWAEEGGFEVANHTMTHAIDDISAMWRRPYAFDVAQATGPDKLIEPVIGHNTLWLRPMGGNIDATGIKAANDTGHLVINWTVDSNDSHGGPRTPDYLYNQVTKGIKSGDVVLLHVTKQESMDALPRICAELKRQGFEMVTLSELAKHSEPIVANVPK